MATLKKRFRCEQCKSRRILSNLRYLYFDAGWFEPYEVILCRNCADKVSIAGAWTPSWDKRKSFKLISKP